MAAVGNLQVILELDDGNFTTRVVRAGEALSSLEGKANVAVTAVQNITNKMSGGIGSVAGWTIALGEARMAAETLNTVFGSWIEKIVEINSQMEQTTALLAGFSQAADQTARLAEGMRDVQAVMTMATQAPFSFGALQDTFVKLKTAGVDPLGGSMKNLTDAIAAFGGDDSRLNRASYAIQEMAGRGVISLQNLRRQLGQDIPGAVQAMAQSMFMTVEQLDSAVTKGTLDSRNAITLMLDEFDRLYGGAAQQRMNTFRGQVAQLSTEFMRLAQVAGGMTEGANPHDSFYETVVNGLKKLNEQLASPEMQAAAVSINQFLKSLADGATALIPILPTLANNIGLLAKALELLAAVLLAKGLGAAFEALGSTWVKLAGGAGNLIAIVSNMPERFSKLFGAIASGAQIAIGAVTRLGTTILAADGMTAADVALNVGVGVLGQFATGLAAVLVPATAVGAAIYLIGRNLENIPGQAALAGEALSRLRQGDITQANQEAAAKELDQLKQKVALLNQQIDAVNRLKAGGTDSQGLLNVGGAFGTQGSQALSKLFDFEANNPGASEEQIKQVYQQITKDLQDELKTDQAELAVSQADLAAAPLKLLKAQADRVLLDARTTISAAFQKISSDYRARIDEINKQREEAAKNPADQGPLLAANNAQIQAVKDLYDARANILNEAITNESNLIVAAEQAGQQKIAAIHQQVKEALQQDLADLDKASAEALSRLGLVKVNSDQKDFQKQTKEVSTLIQNMSAQVAALNAQLDQTGSFAAKVTQEFSAQGKFNLLGGIDSAQGQEALTIAREIDDLRASLKALKEENAASHQIDLGLDKAEAQLNAYTLRLTDPSMPDAQQKFVLFQNQMEEALGKFIAAAMSSVTDMASFATAIDKISEASNRAANAINTMKSATELGQLEALAKQAHNAWLNSLPPAQAARERAADFAKNLKVAQDAIRGDANLTPDQRAQADALAAKAANEFAAGANNRVARADAAAARPGENAVAQLASRLSELQAKLVGGNSELAKWNTLIEQQPAKYAGQAAAIRQYAQAIDEANAKLKKFNEAQQALKNLENQKDKAQTGADLQRQYEGLGKMLDVERQLFNFQRNNQLNLNKVAAGPNAANDLPKAQADADAATAAEGLRLIRQKVEANKNAEDTIRKSFDDTLEARRASGAEEINFEDAKLHSLLQKYVTDSDERKKLESETDSYIAAKREELARKTQDALQKEAHDWADSQDAITNYAAQGLSTFVDDLTTQLTTGKAKWTDFANWAIQELLRIQLRSALSPLASLGSKGLSAGFSWLGSLFSGGGAGKGGVAPATAAPGRFFAYHSGGMVGSEASFVRSFSDSLLANAPRFHSGAYLQSDEVPAILQKGEGVFTAGQLGVIGDLNHNYQFVEQALASLVNAANQFTSAPQAPANVTPAPLYSAGSNTQSGSTAAPPVTINVSNQTSSPISAVASTPKFDGEAMVLDIVVRNTQQPGPLRDAIRGIR